MGRFPILSNRGNQYIMDTYGYDSNAILVELMKNKLTTEIIAKHPILHYTIVFVVWASSHSAKGWITKLK